MKTLQPRTMLRSSLFAAATIGMAPMLSAQSFDLTLDPVKSSTSLVSDYGVALPGTLIGNFDPVDNPTGTTTLPGIIGGSGNNPINVDLGFGGDVDFSAVPSGGLTIHVSTVDGTVDVEGLALDLLGGSPATTDLTLSLLYDTFRTTNPAALFLGGIPFDVPLGSSSISDVVLVQDGRSTLGIVTPSMKAGFYDLTVVVPVSLSLNVDVLGTPFPVGPITVPLPIVGELEIDPNGFAEVSLSFGAMDQISLPDPLPGFELTDIPLPLPTILPPGGVANLLLNATIASLDFDYDVSASFVASGGLRCGLSTFCSANPNSAGLTATIDITGSSDVLDGDLTLSVQNVPTNVFGIFIMSEARSIMPLGGPSDGFLCLDAPCYRLRENIQFSGPTGSVSMGLDFANLPDGQVFTAGSTWHFQFWHRDMNPGSTSNTSPGATVSFCD